MGAITFIIPFIVLITLVVFIHEYGHYYFAKKYGVGVTDFSIGFGKEIFGFNDKSGTRWKFCLIPLGGYVKFLVIAMSLVKQSKKLCLNDIAKQINKNSLSQNLFIKDL